MFIMKISLVHGLIFTKAYNQWYVVIKIVLATKTNLIEHCFS